MVESFVFSGFGGAVPAHRVTNEQLQSLQGFSPERIERSPEYQAWRATRPEATPYMFFVEERLGFRERYHVAPFPPAATPAPETTTVDLAVEAMSRALEDAGITARQVGAWVMSTVSGPQQAPDALSLAKRRLAGDDDFAQTFPIHGGCGGFNLGLQVAQQVLRAEPEIEHVVVAHAETMSRFLRHEQNFVPHVTFGDGAACVVVSRRATQERTGLLHVFNRQDPAFLDVLGVSAGWDLFIEPKRVKERAIADMTLACARTLEKLGLTPRDIDLFVPHQTGNAILFDLARQLGVADKLYSEAQARFGNVSGATVPIALWALARDGGLRPGMTILSTSAGVGGLFGAFCYRVPAAA